MALRSCAAPTRSWSWRRVALKPCAVSAMRRASEAESSAFRVVLPIRWRGACAGRRASALVPPGWRSGHPSASRSHARCRRSSRGYCRILFQNVRYRSSKPRSREGVIDNRLRRAIGQAGPFSAVGSAAASPHVVETRAVARESGVNNPAIQSATPLRQGTPGRRD